MPKIETESEMLQEVDEAAKSGARNSAADMSRLQMIHDYAAENGAECSGAGKSLNLAYIKSLGLSDDLGAVKSIGNDEIKGYLALWGKPELTDVELEYFTPQTDFWDAQLGKSVRPLTWDHAQDDTLKASPIIGQIVDFGDDAVGRWYTAKLDRAHRYRKAIDALIDAGKLGTSSDSAPQYVVREKTGKSTWIKTWPLFAAALTNTPAEPRMIGSLKYLKSLGIVLPDSPVQGWQWQNARMKRYSILISK